MRPVIALATLIAIVVILAGVTASTPPDKPLEIVPPVPSFGVEDRVQQPDGTTPPYGANQPSLRDLAQQAGMLVGAAVEPNDMAWEPKYDPLVAREFSIVTTENVLKFGLVRKTGNRYVFGPADVIVDFAQQNNIKVRGHTLVWHEQLPDWLKIGDYTSQELSDLLEQHIKTLVGRYKGRIQYWDVVNEAVDWDGSMRDTIWSENLGPDYIDKAFEWAHEADPTAKLFYNDYSAEGLGDKSDAVYNLVMGMVERGVPIDGVGFQGHFSLDNAPNPADVAANIQRLAALGLEVQFTEVDVRIPDPVTDEKLQKQADIYWSMMNVCAQNPACTAFITWGVTDKFSWINTFLKGYSAGLMFDENYDPKPAYWAVRDALERRLNISPYATASK
jgi:endo-1,4-beta-xylanase